jgi:hypothetical protein
MAAILAPDYYGTMVRAWFETSGPKPKAFVLTSDENLNHQAMTDKLTALIAEFGPIIAIHLDRITVDMVDQTDEGLDRIRVLAMSVKTVEVDDEE